MNAPTVLVSILNYNSFEPTLEAIASFRAQTYPAMKLQMVDNASTTDCVERIERAFPDLSIVRSPSNLGYTGGNNLALEKAIAEGFDYVLICNEDIAVGPDAVARLVETARSRPDAGVLGGVEVDYETGRPRATGGTRFPDWRFRIHWPVDPPFPGVSWSRVLYVQGALVMFTRAALEAGIRFDDALFIYWDEIELGYQLREKGLASAAKRAGRSADQGRVDSYIHFNNTVGVLIEVNCETDFVANTDQFKALVKDLALHIASPASPIYLDRGQVPQDVIDQETKIAETQAREAGKPDNVVPKIVEGKVASYLKDTVLLEQSFVKDDSKTVQQLLDETSAAVGEKVAVRRFVRYKLGEEGD